MLGIGFDSGGSRTTYSLNRGGEVVRSESSECADSIADARGSRSMRAATAWIAQVLESQSDEDVCAWIGAAGFSGSSAHAITEAFESVVPRLRDTGKNIEVFIANDAV